MFQGLGPKKPESESPKRSEKSHSRVPRGRLYTDHSSRRSRPDDHLRQEMLQMALSRANDRRGQRRAASAGIMIIIMIIIVIVVVIIMVGSSSHTNDHYMLDTRRAESI